MHSKQSYNIIPSSPDGSPLPEIDSSEHESLVDGRVPRTRVPWRSLSFVVATVLNIAFFVASTMMWSSWYYTTHVQMNSKLRQASSFSPIHDLVDLSMHVETMNGTLFPPRNNPSVGRQSPNDEADALWQEWEITRVVPVTEAQIRAMGKDPSTAAKLQDEDWGLGDDAYAAIFDTYHHLHCLNVLRQIAYPEHYPQEHMHMHTIPGMWEVHINHCVDLIMQAIQCAGNVNLITLHWVDNQPHPFPDMSVDRQCINFDALTEWRLENTLDMDKYLEVMQSENFPDAKRLRAPDDYYVHFKNNTGNPNHLDGANPGEDFNL